MSTFTTVIRSTVAAAVLGIAGLGLAGTAAAAPVSHLDDQTTIVAAQNPAPADLIGKACTAARLPGSDCGVASPAAHKDSKGR